MTFYKLGIKKDLIDVLNNLNIVKPTPIQTLTIPLILSGEDIIAEAQTGTGKTYAFLLPMFQNIDRNNDSIQGLIIAPTRELALQITEVAKTLIDTYQLNILTIYGGQDVNAQLHKLNGNVQVVIGTPGRILDHLRRGSINFNNLKTFVLDEADQMLHIGFLDEINCIIDQLPKDKQSLFFSATISKDVNKFAYRYLANPFSIKAPKEQITLDNIKQIVLETSNRKKFDDFITLLNQNISKKVIIFCRSRVGTQTLYESMLEAGYNVDALHGALTQAKREATMNAFKNNKIKYLVATDVASRGIDVTDVTHVYNYNLPDDTESYVHRIGRTGRAGNIGTAFTILTKKDEKRLEGIEDFIKMKIKRIRFSEYDIKEEKVIEKKKPITDKRKKVNKFKSKSKFTQKKKKSTKSRIR